MSNYKFSDSDKNAIHQWNRMQDMVMSYAQLAIKSTLIICGGALVSIGAAFVSFLSLEKNTNKDAALLLRNILAEGFESFSMAISLILLILVLIYMARICFLTGCDRHRHSGQVCKRHNICGSILESLAFLIFLYVIYIIVSTFTVIGDTFSQYPISSTITIS